MLISLDPGNVHCGIAAWKCGDEGWHCDWAVEREPDRCVDLIKTLIEEGSAHEIVMEGFWLRSGKMALRQAGSAFEVVEVIGTIRNLCRWNGISFDKISPGVTAATRKRVIAAGYKPVAYGQGDHAIDAEMVGIAHLRLKVRDLL